MATRKKKPSRRPAPRARAAGSYAVTADLRGRMLAMLERQEATPAELRAIAARFAKAVAVLPPEDDLPLEPGEGASATVVGRAASPADRFYMDATGGQSPEWDPSERARLQAYVDYGDMKLQFPEFGRALDVIAEGATSNDRGEPPYRLLWAPGVDEATRQIGDDCNERLRLPEEIKPVCHSSTWFGDLFGELPTSETGLIVSLEPRRAGTMFRVDDEFGRVDHYEQRFPGSSRVVVFAPGQVVHLRAGHEWGCRYGTSMFASGRFVYRKYALMDDAMVVNRLVRAIQRYEIEVDIADMTEKEAQAHVQKVMDRTRREPIFTADGKLDLSTRAMADLQDLFTAKRRPDIGGVNVLEGSRTLGTVNDVHQVYRRLLVLLPVPPSFLGVEADVNARATVSEQGINYARYLRAKQQRELGPFVAKIIRRQCALFGRLVGRGDLEVRFAPPSVLDEKMRADTLLVKAEAAKLMGVDLGFPTEFLVRYVLDLSPEQADDVLAMVADEEAAGTLPPPTAPPPVPDGAPVAAARLGRGVRGALEAQRQTRDALHALQATLRYLADERRAAQSPAVAPSPEPE